MLSCYPKIAEKNVAFFSEAEPIWPEGKEFDMNITIGFKANFKIIEEEEVTLRITGSSLYRIFLNGEFIGHGPARAGHGYYRVDEIALEEQLIQGTNILALEVVSYNVNSFYLLDQPGFIQAEILVGNNIVAATSENSTDFEAFELKGRIQKTPRYSFQRPFTECYKISPEYDDWRTSNDHKLESINCDKVQLKKLIPRGLPYSNFAKRKPKTILTSGKIKTDVKKDKYWKDRAVVNIGEKLRGFKESDLAFNPAIQLQETEIESSYTQINSYTDTSTLNLEEKQFHIIDYGINLTGFIGATLEVNKGGRFYFTFDEILSEDDVDFKRLGCINAVVYDLTPGNYTLESFEPYTFRYLKILSIDAIANVSNIYLREYTNPDIEKAIFSCSDERLNRIFKAGVETFRQNAVDVFMDCPSRERAGWLCDSYFASRVAQDISGHALIEKNFFENYLLPDTFEFIPSGMLPMCYPADHNDGVFIPNWAMWFVIQLKEYYERTNDLEMVMALKPKVLDLLKYFRPFLNEFGLLESLDSWIFVEWSAANRFVQDVNFPTNMLYASTLEVAGALYDIDSLVLEAGNIRDTIRKLSFNGDFFVDNAIRNLDDKLEITKNTTEVCQYYAYYFDVANPSSHPKLWQILTEKFGPDRMLNDPYPKVHPANSFVGNYLRLELLSQYGLQSQLLNESIDFFDYMAQRTGTLWENQSPSASCNHGFASHVVHVLYRDVLGIKNIDYKNKAITLRFSDLDLSDCKGQIPIGDDLLEFSWKKEDNKIIYQIKSPEEYMVRVENQSRFLIKKGVSN